MSKAPSGRRRQSSIRFLKLPTGDVWREPIWGDNDLLAAVVRLRAMLDREESESGRIYLTPSAIRVLTGARKVDRAWRILERLHSIGVIELDRIGRGSGPKDRVDLERSGRSFAKKASDRLDCASILDPKWSELQGFENRLDRQNGGGHKPPHSVSAGRRLENEPSSLAAVPAPAPALDRAAMARASSEARDAIARAQLRFTAGQRTGGGEASK